MVATAVDVAVSRHSTCVLMEDGSVQCTGHNTWGTLGNGKAGSNAHTAEPVEVVGSKK